VWFGLGWIGVAAVGLVLGVRAIRRCIRSSAGAVPMSVAVLATLICAAICALALLLLGVLLFWEPPPD
jgi:hypothetical protein